MPKRRIIFFSVYIMVFSAALLMLNAAFGVASTASAQVQGVTAADRGVVIIDAGHGDFDPGCVAADGTEEKWINLRIATYLRDIFGAHGYKTVMTRTDDTTLADYGGGHVKRTDTLNRAALFDSFADAVTISIHQNSFSDSSQHGTQLFYGVKNDESRILAEYIMQSVTSALQPDNSRPLKQGTSSIYILKNVESPIVLVECGFMTNGDELELLKDNEYCKKIAYCIFCGYEEYITARDNTGFSESDSEQGSV